MGGTEQPISIPAVLVSMESGALLKETVPDGSNLRLLMCYSDGFLKTSKAQKYTEEVTEKQSGLHFVAHTQLIHFLDNGKKVIPEFGKLYPNSEDDGGDSQGGQSAASAHDGCCVVM